MTSQQPRSLAHREAVERAALLEVTSYDVRLDLDRGEQTFGSSTTIDLVSAGGTTFLDVQPVRLLSVTVNGQPVDVGTLDRGRIGIVTDPGPNQVVVEAEMRYRHDGEGLHRAVDPADGRDYVYAMTFLDAAPSIFACFDQPDLKAVWRLEVVAPRDWTVLGNSPATQVEPGRWQLAQTLPLPTYLVALVAGPYHVLRSEHDGIPLGLSARASIARFLDADAEELFTVTAQSFDELHRLFGMRYPFGDYHQAFVPEFNAGAMESAGCVTFRDPLVFQSRVTRAEHTSRAITVAHEMAHMWFGDIVTPVWWDDLWLNESFAEYMGSRVVADATEFTESWLHDAYPRRGWGLTADQRPSTHPVAGNGAVDSASALQNFDGISYAKGASVIKQLNSRLGDEVFFGGVRNHFARHRLGNATMADLVGSWERAGAGDLSRFTDSWLLTAGPDQLELDRAAGVLRRTPPAGHPADREHVLALASRPDCDSPWESQRLVVAGDETPVSVPPGPVLVDPALETWAVTLPDEETLAALPEVLARAEEPLLRASIWDSVRSAFRHARLDPELALTLVESGAPAEVSDDGVTWVLRWALWEVAPVCADREAARERVHRAAGARIRSAPAGSSLQLSAFRLLVPSCGDAAQVRAWLEGRDLPDGLTVDLEVRWLLLRRLAALGDADRDELDRALAEEPTAVSTLEHVKALASIPDDEAKSWAWQRFTGEVEVPNYELEAAGIGLWQLGQEHLTDSYVGRYFDELPGTASVRTGQLLQLATGIFYPRWAIADHTVARAAEVLADGDLPSMIRRELVDETADLQRLLAVRKAFVHA